MLKIYRKIKARPPESRGLGDYIELALSKVGITKQRIEDWIGEPCGCAERQEKLNRLGNWAKKILSGEPQ